MTSQSMLILLEKINAQDKDFRYMATSDLAAELQKDQFVVVADVEKRLCGAVVARLDDSSGDISSLAVKCLGLLVTKVSQPRAVDLVSQLCDKVITPVPDKEEQRVVATIALKNVVHVAQGTPIANTLAPLISTKMLNGTTKDNADVVGDAIEVLGELADKAGPALASEHSRIRDALLHILNDPRAVARKRALQCLAAISVYLNDDLLSGAVTALLQRIKAGNLKPDLLRIYIQALGQISRAVGYRFGKHVDEAVALAIKYCQGAGENDDDLREYSLQALEGFVLHVPIDSKSQLDDILKLSISNLRYDPNFADDDMELDQDHDEDMDDDDVDEDGYSDDEDVSWKVRRAAVKTLNALVSTYADALPKLYETAAEALVQRFQEREESVRSDVFNAYITLARQVGAVSSRYVQDDPASPVKRLASHVPAVVKAITKQLKQRSLKARVSSFQLLRELAIVLPGAVAANFKFLVPGIVSALSDKSSASSALKIEALLFTRAALADGPKGAAADISQLKQLNAVVLACANERYYKVSAEAVRVLEQIIMVLRPMPPYEPADLSSIPLQQILHVLQTRLTSPDQDQEVKDAAISATAVLGARCGDALANELPALLCALLDRLRNEITRLAAVRAFHVLAESPLTLDIGPSLEPIVQELTSFLKKAQRRLRLAALRALESICDKFGKQLPSTVLVTVTEEASLLIVDSDLALAAQALRTLSALLRVQPSAASPATVKALPAALALLGSPLLQGSALDQLKTFLAALAASKQPGTSADELMHSLLAAGKRTGTQARGAPLAAAQCVAVLASVAGPTKVADTARTLLKDISSSDDASQRLALLCVGELGRRADLSSIPQVEEAIYASLLSDGEDVKTAASQALGGVACGNLNKYMPKIIKLITESSTSPPRRQYLLLGSLNEVLSTVSAPSVVGTAQSQDVTPVMQQPQLAPGDRSATLSLLLSMADSAHEECKMVIAECLGKVALLEPQQALSELQKRLSDPSVNARVVVVSSLRYMVTERPHPIDTPLAAAVGPFLALISDSDHNVRRAAVVALAAIAHQKPGLVASGRDGAPPPLLALLPLLYQQTHILTALIRTVDLGPFKHKIDDGLELRKSVFECMDILMDSPSCCSLLDMPTFVQHLQLGLADHADIKAHCHLVLAKLASIAPVAVLSGAEGLIGPLEATITPAVQYLKKTSDTVKQELDRHNDTLRSCLRAVHAVAMVPGVETCAPFQTFMKRIMQEPIVRTKYNEVSKEWSDANTHLMDLS